VEDRVAGRIGLDRPQRLDEGPLAELAFGGVELASRDRSLALDLVLQVDDRLDELLGARWAARHVHVDGDEPIDPLDDGVGVEHAAGARAGAHRDAPFGLAHLQPDPLQHRQHLHHHAAGDDHQIALPRAEAEHLGTEPCEVVLAGAGGHQLDPAAGGGERHRPEAVLPAPARQFVEPADDDVLGQL